MKLIVGLGNPGSKYAATRHNAGFWFVERLARQWRVEFSAERKFQALVARANVSEASVWLMMPQTFMNLSGDAVGAFARFYDIQPEEILVAHDELDLKPGEAKLKQGGGHAGHNGLKSLDVHLNSKEYWRLRLGIGHPGTREEVVDYVLQKPQVEEREAIDAAIDKALGLAEHLARGEMTIATMKLHTKPKPPKAESSEGTKEVKTNES